MGNTANTLTIRNGSTFDVNASTIDASLKAYSTGSFVFEDGTTLTHTGGGTARSVFADELDFAGDVTLAGNGRLDIDGTINVSGTDITITMTNSRGNVIGGNNSAQSIGLWLVQSGSTLFYSAANNLGNNADVRVESGGIFRANGGANWTTSNDLFLEAGSSLTKRDTNRTVTLDGTITVEGACTVSLSSEIWGLNGILTDAGDLTIQDTGSLRIGSSFDDSGYTGAMIFSDTGNNKQIQFTEAAASATVSADITISETTAGNFDLDITDAGSTLTLSGDISGSGAAGITKLSAGTAVLSGTNAYTGVTTISAGTLQLGSGGTTGALTGTGTITNDAALIVNRSNAFYPGYGPQWRGNRRHWHAYASWRWHPQPCLWPTPTQARQPSLRGPLELSGTAGALSGTTGITNNSNLTISRSNAFTQATDLNGQAIDGTGSVTQAGAGTTTLSATNTYTGTTTIDSGTLQAGSTQAFGVNSATTVTSTLLLDGNSNTLGSMDGAGSVVNDNDSATAATLTVGGGGATGTFSGSISDGSGGGALSLSKTGAGAQTLSGANTYTGGTSLGAGTLNINSTTAIGATASALTISGSPTIDNTSGGAITLANNNPITLGSDLTFAGSNALNFGAGNVTLSADRTITVSASELTLGGVVDDGASTFALNAAGSGTLVLQGDNTHGGQTNINVNATIRAEHDNAFGTGRIFLARQAAWVELANGVDVGNNLSMQNSARPNGARGIRMATTATSATFSGDIDKAENTNGDFRIITASGQTLTLSGVISNNNNSNVNLFGDGLVVISGDNTHDEATTLISANGTVRLEHNNATGGDGVYMQQGGTTVEVADGINIPTRLNVTNTGGGKSLALQTGATSAEWSGTVLINETTANAFFVISDGAGELTLSGVISGGGAAGLNKTGTGTVILTASNTYSAATTISAGTLQIGDGGTTGQLTGTNSITNNGALIINRSNDVTQATDLNDQAIGGTGSLTLAGDSTKTFTLANTYSGTTTVSAGPLIVTGGSTGSGDLTVASVALPAWYKPDGESVLTAFKGQKFQRTKPIFWEWRGGDNQSYTWPSLAIRDGKWKLLVNRKTERMELYDLESDWAETKNVVADHPEIAQRLSDMIATWKASLPTAPSKNSLSKARTKAEKSVPKSKRNKKKKKATK